MRIRIEHDPDDMCAGCPFLRSGGHEIGGDWISEHACSVGGEDDEIASAYEPAPEWCPLRQDIIEVGAPGAWRQESREENDE